MWIEGTNVETKNLKREIKCRGGSQTVKVLDVDFGYLDQQERQVSKYAQDLHEIIELGKAEEKQLKAKIDSYIFLHDIGEEFRIDRSNLRKFVINHGIFIEKLRHPILGQVCGAITKEDAKLLMKLKFGG